MGCCQSQDQDIDLQERELLGDAVSLGSDWSNSELENEKQSRSRSKELIGYDQILKDRQKLKSYNSNRLVSGFIDVNVVNTPKADFFSQYQIGKFLGQGGFGTVCVATHKVTGAKRAIKMVSKSALSTSEMLKLLEELELLKEIDHPNILKILEHYEDDQHHFFVTELLSGGELFSKILDLNGFDENKASDYIRQILSAVSYCHAHNIVHRDLKPENILFESKRPNSQIKVIDFGCSTKFDRRKKIKDMAGTVLYLAPEVIKKDLYDEKCDIWSLGVVLFIMLSGYPPFDGVTDEELFDRIQYQELSFDSPEWTNISDEAKDLLMHMLIKDPEKRISASEAYQHPWIQRNMKTSNLQESIMNNLAQFSARNKVKTAVMNMITLHILSNKDKQQIIKNFHSLDQNGDGQLSKEELIQGYEKIIGDKDQAEKIVEAVFLDLDYDGSGLVSFQEFLVATVNKEKMFSRENLNKAFELIDEDRNGYITKEELEKLMGGTPINEAVWEKMMKECDTNGDGQLDKLEFVDLLMKWLDRDLFDEGDSFRDEESKSKEKANSSSKSPTKKSTKLSVSPASKNTNGIPPKNQKIMSSSKTAVTTQNIGNNRPIVSNTISRPIPLTGPVKLIKIQRQSSPNCLQNTANTPTNNQQQNHKNRPFDHHRFSSHQSRQAIRNNNNFMKYSPKNSISGNPQFKFKYTQSSNMKSFKIMSDKFHPSHNSSINSKPLAHSANLEPRKCSISSMKNDTPISGAGYQYQSAFIFPNHNNNNSITSQTNGLNTNNQQHNIEDMEVQTSYSMTTQSQALADIRFSKKDPAMNNNTSNNNFLLTSGKLLPI